MKKSFLAAVAAAVIIAFAPAAQADDYSVTQNAVSLGAVNANGFNGAGALSGNFSNQGVSASGAVSSLSIKFDGVDVIMPNNFTVNQAANNNGNIGANGMNVAFGELSGSSASQSVGATGAVNSASFSAVTGGCGCQ